MLKYMDGYGDAEGRFGHGDGVDGNGFVDGKISNSIHYRRPFHEE